jgi:hypothetical protein
VLLAAPIATVAPATTMSSRRRSVIATGQEVELAGYGRRSRRDDVRGTKNAGAPIRMDHRRPRGHAELRR